MMESQKSKVKSQKLISVLLLLLCSFYAHGQGIWKGVSGPAQKDTVTGEFRWNFGTDGLFLPAIPLIPTNGIQRISLDSIGLGGGLTRNAITSLLGHSYVLTGTVGSATATFAASYGAILMGASLGTNNYAVAVGSGTSKPGAIMGYNSTGTGQKSQININKNSMSVYDTQGVGLIDSVHHAITDSRQLAEIQDVNNIVGDTTLLARKIGTADMVQHSYTGYTQTIYNPTGQAYTKYINGAGTTLSYGIMGMQSMQELNYSWNFIYDKPNYVGRHQYIDTAWGEFHWALGGRYGRLQYTPKGAPNTGVNTLTITSAGSGYTPGTYDLITANSTRTPATNERYAITVGAGGTVTSCTSDAVGAGYQAGDVVTVPTLPGGTGFSTTVVTLATDNWGYFGKQIGVQVDNVTNTVQLGWNGNLTPAANSTLVQIGPRSIIFQQYQLSGPSNGSGFAIGGGNVGSNEAIYLNPYDLGNTFISGGGGNVTFGSNGTPTSGFGVFNPTTASSGAAWGMRLRPTVIASANNDVLYGAYFDAIYTTGAFTGVTPISARFNTAPIQFQTISAPVNPLEGMMLHTGTAWEVYTNSTFYRLALQTNVTASTNQTLIANSTGQWVPTTGLPSGFTGVTPGSNANSTIIPTEAWTNTYFGPLAGNNAWAGTNTFNGKFNMSTAANGPTGFATLVAGTVTVSNTSVTTNSIIVLTRKTAGGTVGTLSYTPTAGTSFTITSSSATDTSTLGYTIIN